MEGLKPTELLNKLRILLGQSLGDLNRQINQNRKAGQKHLFSNTHQVLDTGSTSLLISSESSHHLTHLNHIKSKQLICKAWNNGACLPYLERLCWSSFVQPSAAFVDHWTCPQEIRDRQMEILNLIILEKQIRQTSHASRLTTTSLGLT